MFGTMREAVPPKGRPNEIVALRAYAGTMSVEDVAERIPGRSIAAVLAKASVVNLSLKQPQAASRTAPDVESARLVYREQGMEGLRKLFAPDASVVTVTKFARLHKLKTDVRRPKVRWTSELDAVLTDLYPLGGKSAVLTRLPGLTAEAIQMRAFSLGLRRSK
jgi:hypothetical protein